MKRLLCMGVVAALLAAGCGKDLEQENQKLHAQLSQLQQEHQATEDRLAELQKKNADLQQQLDAMGMNKGQLESQLAEMKKREAAQRERLKQFHQMLSQFASLIQAGKLKVKIDRGKMIVELPESVLFDSAKAKIKDEGKATLKQVAQVLASIPNREYLVAGHTDNVPIRSRRYPSNWELSAARGVNVAKFLAENGVPEDRLAAAGYADTEPVASNDTPEGRAQNRRIEIILMPNVEELPDLSSLQAELNTDEAEGASAPAAPAAPAQDAKPADQPDAAGGK